VNNPLPAARFSGENLNLPLQFIPNAGQTAPQVRYTVKGAGHNLFFTPDQVVSAPSAPVKRACCA